MFRYDKSILLLSFFFFFSYARYKKNQKKKATKKISFCEAFFFGTKKKDKGKNKTFKEALKKNKKKLN